MLARGLLAATKDGLTQAKVAVYLEAVQEIDPLRLAEIDNFLMCLKLVLLELLAQRGNEALEAFRKSGRRQPRLR